MNKEQFYNDLIEEAIKLQDKGDIEGAKYILNKVKSFKEADGAKFAYVTGDSCESCT